jgi:hypothetical protein
VNEYLLELYVSRTDDHAVEQSVERMRLALEQQGTPVRYLRSIFVPEDETCYLLFEAASVEAVREAAQLAGLPFAHVAAAIETEGKP